MVLVFGFALIVCCMVFWAGMARKMACRLLHWKGLVGRKVWSIDMDGSFEVGGIVSQPCYACL